MVLEPILLAGLLLGAVIATALIVVWAVWWFGRPPRTAFRLPTRADLTRDMHPTTMIIAVGISGAELALEQLRRVLDAGRQSAIGSILFIDLGDRHRGELIVRLPYIFHDRLVWPAPSGLSKDFEGSTIGEALARESEWRPAVRAACERAVELHLRRNARPPAFLACYASPGPDSPIAEAAIGSISRRFSLGACCFVVLPPHDGVRQQFADYKARLEAAGVDIWVIGDSAVDEVAARDAVLAPLTALPDPQNELGLITGGVAGTVLAGRVASAPIPARSPRPLHGSNWVPQDVMQNCCLYPLRQIDTDGGLRTVETQAAGTLDPAAPALDLLLVSARWEDVPRIEAALHQEAQVRAASNDGASVLGRPARATRLNYAMHVAPWAPGPVDPRDPKGLVLAVRFAPLSVEDAWRGAPTPRTAVNAR